MKASIYTRKGDHGETSLFTGEKVSKDDLRVHTYGTLDELQAQLGMARSLIKQDSLCNILFGIQEDIYIACAQLASNPEKASRLKKIITSEDITKLEKYIDNLFETYGLPNKFIVPGRSPDSAAVHVARTVCRRSERLLVMLNRELHIFDDICMYINRLSDFLFALGWSLEVIYVIENVTHDIIKEPK